MNVHHVRVRQSLESHQSLAREKELHDVYGSSLKFYKRFSAQLNVSMKQDSSYSE